MVRLNVARSMESACGCSPAALSCVLVDLREDDEFAAEGKLGNVSARMGRLTASGGAGIGLTTRAAEFLHVATHVAGTRSVCTGSVTDSRNREGPNGSGHVPINAQQATYLASAS